MMLKMIIDKEMLEDELKIKIQSYKLEPLYKKDVCIGLMVSVVADPKYQDIANRFKDNDRISIDPITGNVKIK